MASSIFAGPFRYAPTYDVGLNTGTPEVGATLRRPKNKKTPEEEKVPTRVPNETNGNGEISGAQSGSNSAGLTAGVGRGAGIANSRGVGYSAMQHMAAEDNAAGNGNLSQSQFETLIHPNPISAPANPSRTVSAPSGGGSIWGTIGHYASDIGNGIVSGAESAGHAVNSFAHNGVVRDVMSFGDPVKRYDQGGLVGAVNQSASAPASDVIEPSNVYSPSRNFGQVGPRSPQVIQGYVEGPGQLGAANVRNALPRAYTSPSEFEDMMRGSGAGDLFNNVQFGQNAASTASRAASTPWYDTLGSDLGGVAEDLFAGVG